MPSELNKERLRKGRKWCFSSAFASVLSLVLFKLYVDWHWQLFDADGKGVTLPEWINWQLVDIMKGANTVSAAIGFMLAIQAIRKEKLVMALLVLLLALFALLSAMIQT